MPEAVERIHAAAGILREEHTPCDAVGKLTDRTTQVIKESQGMRLLQSLQCGGLQADITDFYAWVRAVAQYNPSAGWVAGVVGKSDPLQQEALAEADSDLAAGIAHLDLISHKMLEQLRTGHAMNVTMRLDFRRNKVAGCNGS